MLVELVETKKTINHDGNNGTLRKTLNALMSCSVVTFGEKGVDTLNMESTLAARSTTISRLTDSLEKAIRSCETDIRRGNGRNRLIYCLANYAIVIGSDAETDGTWAEATETLKMAGAIFVLEHSQMPEGNKLWLQKGGIALLHPFRESPLKLTDWLNEKSSAQPQAPQPE